MIKNYSQLDKKQPIAKIGKDFCKTQMTKIFIASRIGTKTKKRFEKNLNKMRAFARFAMLKGYEPEATGIYYCQFMNDFDPKERELGIEKGLERLKECEGIWVLEDGLAFSDGARREMDCARKNDIQLYLWNVETVESYLKATDKFGYALWQKGK